VLISFLHLKPDFKYSSLSFARINRVESRINLHLSGKISLELDFNFFAFRIRPLDLNESDSSNLRYHNWSITILLKLRFFNL